MPEGAGRATAAEMATATADDVYVHRIQCCTVYVVIPCIPADLVPDHLVVGTARERDNTHDRYAVYQDLSLYASWAVQPLPSNVLARVHPWVSFE